ncbi:peptidylprolyl isomerase [bacterium]|nr:peptidylprolyl isomerase [bacterium]
MQISKDKVVSVHYKLEVNGEKIDESGDQPLVYLHGHNMMIPGFEKNLENLESGAKYDFELKPEEGYGEYTEERVADLDKSIFLIDGTMSPDVFVGAQLRLRNEQGQPLIGVVTEIKDEHVQMDFNHQLAGKTLHFTGEIQDVREATAEEISHGHVHGEGGHSH